MNMKGEVVIFSVNHYDMEGQKGLSVRVLGGFEETSNKFGRSVSEAPVIDYGELSKLEYVKNSLPAKFEAEMEMVSRKLSNGKEATVLGLKNLKFLAPLELVEVKPSVK